MLTRCRLSNARLAATAPRPVGLPSVAPLLLAALLAWTARPAMAAADEAGAPGKQGPAAKADKGKNKAGKAANPKAEAKKSYKQGSKLYKQGKWAEALVSFRASFESNGDPAVRFDIGMCLLELGQWLEAEGELKAYLEATGEGIEDGRRKAVLEAIDEIGSHVAVVTVECDTEEATLVVDGEPFYEWEIRLQEGQHDLLATAKGFDPVSKKIDLQGGQPVTVEIEMTASVEGSDGGGKKKSGKKKGSKTVAGSDRKKLPVYWFASTAGLAGALAVAAIVTGSIALNRQDVYASMGADEDWKPYRDTTLRLGIATDVMWGIAGAAAVAAVVLGVFTAFGERKDSKDGKHGTALSLDPLIGAGWMGLRGEF